MIGSEGVLYILMFNRGGRGHEEDDDDGDEVNGDEVKGEVL